MTSPMTRSSSFGRDPGQNKPKTAISIGVLAGIIAAVLVLLCVLVFIVVYSRFSEKSSETSSGTVIGDSTEMGITIENAITLDLTVLADDNLPGLAAADNIFVYYPDEGTQI
jgi:hypothetical protein